MTRANDGEPVRAIPGRRGPDRRPRRAGQSVACAESLTGGLVCGALTEVPGASAVVRGGVVSYATDVKAGVLGVDPGLLASLGAVNAEVARQMAQGVPVLASDWGLATTGVAGPDPRTGRPWGLCSWRSPDPTAARPSSCSCPAAGPRSGGPRWTPCWTSCGPASRPRKNRDPGVVERRMSVSLAKPSARGVRAAR